MKKFIEVFNEKTALKKLMNESDFRSYYLSERPKIKKDIIWIKDPNLPIGINGAARIKATGEINLSFRMLPAPSAAAHLIAHELQHLVHNETRNIPALQIIDPIWYPLCATITSSVHDLVVESDLVDFGFDICTDFENEFRNYKTLYSTEPEPSPLTAYRDFVLFAVNFASYRADYDFVSTEFGFDDYSFGNWFSSRYPNILETADEIYKQLKAVDISNNASIKNYLQWVLTNYQLTNIAKL